MPVRTSMTYLASGSPDIRRALAAGFSPDEVRYMFALDLTEVELDDEQPTIVGSKPDRRADG